LLFFSNQTHSNHLTASQLQPTPSHLQDQDQTTRNTIGFACLTCGITSSTATCLAKSQQSRHGRATIHHVFLDLTLGGELYCSACEDYIYSASFDTAVSRTLASKVIEHGNDSTAVIRRPTPQQQQQEEGEAEEELRQQLVVSAGVNLGLDIAIPTPPPLFETIAPIDGLPLGLRGLNNMGNTCFMNAIIQAMAHSPVLRNHFLMGCHNRASCGIIADGGCCVSCELDTVFSAVYNGGRTPVSPASFLHCWWSLIGGGGSLGSGYSQQDAHEFFLCILEMIASVEGTKNIAADVYGGLLRSDVSCSKCGHTSTTEDPFTNISLEVPPQTEVMPAPIIARPNKNAINGKAGAAKQQQRRQAKQLTGAAKKAFLAKLEREAALVAAAAAENMGNTTTSPTTTTGVAVDGESGDDKESDDGDKEPSNKKVKMGDRQEGVTEGETGGGGGDGDDEHGNTNSNKRGIKRRSSGGGGGDGAKDLDLVKRARTESPYPEGNPIIEESSLIMEEEDGTAGGGGREAAAGALGGGGGGGGGGGPAALGKNDDVSKHPALVKYQNWPGVNVQGCLHKFIKEEHLGKTEQQWCCPCCSSTTTAIKQLSIAKLPPIMTLHAKRFEHSGGPRAQARKLETYLSFPLTGLDARPFLSSTVLRQRYAINPPPPAPAPAPVASNDINDAFQNILHNAAITPSAGILDIAAAPTPSTAAATVGTNTTRKSGGIGSLSKGSSPRVRMTRSQSGGGMRHPEDEEDEENGGDNDDDKKRGKKRSRDEEDKEEEQEEKDTLMTEGDDDNGDMNNMNASTRDEFLYDLFAVVVHKGNFQGGHYISYVRSDEDGRWYLCDDGLVVAVGEEEVKRSSAYMLFYAQTGLLSHSSSG
jgi:ubiquitin C-terminal hydrolase